MTGSFPRGLVSILRETCLGQAAAAGELPRKDDRLVSAVARRLFITSDTKRACDDPPSVFSRARPVRVNPRRVRIIRTGPLNPNLPPLQTHPQAAAVRHNQLNSGMARCVVALVFRHAPMNGNGSFQ